MLPTHRDEPPAMIRIRCRRSIFRRFKKIAVDFDDYEEALVKLMDVFERFGKLEGKYKAD